MSYKALIFLTFSAAALNATAVDNVLDLIDQSCYDSELVQIAQLRIEAAESSLQASIREEWIPDVELGVSYGYGVGEPTGFFAVLNGEDPAEPSGFREGDAWAAEVDVSLPIVESGRWIGQGGLQRSESQLAITNAQTELQEKQREGQLLIGKYYFDVIASLNKQQIFEPLVEIRASQMRSLESKLEAGLSSRADFYSAEFAYLDAVQQLKNLERKIAIDLAYLDAATGGRTSEFDPESSRSTAENYLSSIVGLADSLEWQVDSLVAKDPEIVALEAEKIHLQNSLKSTKGSMAPDLSLYVRGRSGGDLDEYLEFGEAGIELSYSLGDVPSSQSTRNSERLSLQAIDREIEHTRKLKRLEFMELESDLQGAKSGIQLLESEVRQLKQVLFENSEKLNSGLIGLDVYLDSENRLTDTRLELIDHYVDAWALYLESYSTLYAACGYDQN